MLTSIQARFVYLYVVDSSSPDLARRRHNLVLSRIFRV